jgi:hypothetical protein
MSSKGIGYNISVTTFSPDGCIFQFEYASKTIDNGGFVSLVPTASFLFVCMILLVGLLLGVGGNRARKWTPTQQLHDVLRPPPKGTRPRAPSEANGALFRKLLPC